jgi:hypothetical protein
MRHWRRYQGLPLSSFCLQVGISKTTDGELVETLHFNESMIGDHNLRPITLTWTLTELWYFLSLKKFYNIQAFVLLSSTQNNSAYCHTNSSCVFQILFIDRLNIGS